jgi:hypothetical protein
MLTVAVNVPALAASNRTVKVELPDAEIGEVGCAVTVNSPAPAPLSVT